jgi:ABC-type microcin C transport system permease subunit YejE
MRERENKEEHRRGFKISLFLFLISFILSVTAHILAQPDRYKYDEKTRKFIISEKR